MEIEIPDTCKDKIRYCQIQLVEYGLKLYEGNRKKTAAFIGITPKSLRTWIKEIPELQKYESVYHFEEGNDMWDRYKNSKLWVTKELKDEDSCC